LFLEQSTETQKAPASNKAVIIAISVAAAVIVAAIAIVAVVLLKNSGTASSQPVIGYAAEAKVMLDQNALQAAMDEAVKNAEDGRVGLKYRNNAYSDDGLNFECYIVNSQVNAYDMFLTIFADAEMKDQIFLSELVPPGSGFENITLDHALEVGTHTVYVTLTQVKLNENNEQVIHNQVTYTMDFHVREAASSAAG